MIALADVKVPKKRPAKKSKARLQQFKITLRGITPTMWRRIQVPAIYSFWDLHCAITDSMPWKDYHLHQFQIRNAKSHKLDHIGIPDPDDALLGHKVHASWNKKIADYFSLKTPNAVYLYDFGDGWEHDLLFEGMIESGVAASPRCIAGERACPPEDVGGTGGYGRFLAVIGNPKHAEYRRMLDWGEHQTGQVRFDPEVFDPTLVHFTDPDKRWNVAFG